MAEQADSSAQHQIPLLNSALNVGWQDCSSADGCSFLPPTPNNQACLQMMTNVLGEEAATSPSFENHCSVGISVKATANIHKDQR